MRGDRPKTQNPFLKVEDSTQYETINSSGVVTENDYMACLGVKVENGNRSKLVFGQSGGDRPKTQNPFLKVEDSTQYKTINSSGVATENDYMACLGVKVENGNRSKLVFGQSGGDCPKTSSISFSN